MIKKFFILGLFLISVSILRGEERRQELPGEVVQISESTQETAQEPEERPVSSEKKTGKSSGDFKNFYKKHFNTTLGLSEQWDSNILLDESGENDDFITLINPDVTLHFSNDLGYIETEWIGRYNYYADLDEFTISNSVSALGFLTPNERLALGARGNFDMTEESLVPTVFGDRILQLGYDIISTQPQVKYRWTEKWVSDISYQFDKIDIDNSALDDDVDREGQGFLTNWEFEVTPSLFLIGGYAFRDVNFNENSLKDSFSNLYSGGIRKKIPNLFNVDLKVTYDDKDFDHSPDDENVDIAGSITSTFSRYTTFIFNGSYGLQESSRSEFTQYTTRRFSLILQHYLMPKTVLILKGSYERQTFDDGDLLVTFVTGDQETELYSASVDLRRTLFSWLSVEVGYNFQERDTDFDREDLQDHIIHWGIKAYF
ncbi:MAG: outer membrane beta-barrel protein [Chlamydiae bacterium]|nr:outer membrane beta-barrel protein [Chlamydiota bacterium]MBI3277722.1 outer membrane beta-barrel protein [Chlamydiota bacterium]